MENIYIEVESNNGEFNEMKDKHPEMIELFETKNSDSSVMRIPVNLNVNSGLI